MLFTELFREDTYLSDIPEQYLSDKNFLIAFLSTSRTNINTSLIPKDIFKEVVPYALIQNPEIFVDLLLELQTDENFNIAISSAVRYKKNVEPFLEAILNYSSERKNKLLEDNQKSFYETNISLVFLENNLSKFIQSDVFIKKYSQSIINSSKGIPHKLWITRDLEWWKSNKDAYSFNIQYPYYSDRSKYSYWIKEIPEHFIKDQDFVINLIANDWSAACEIKEFDFTTENSIKVIASYLYYQDNQKFISNEILADNKQCLKIVESFIFNKSEDMDYLDYDRSELTLIQNKQMYAANLFGAFIEHFEYKEIQEHPYWKGLSLNHVVYTVSTDNPNLTFLKSFNTDLKLHILIEKYRELKNKQEHNIWILSPKSNYIYSYLLKEKLWDKTTLANKYQISVSNKDTERTLKDKFKQFISPMLENAYLNYATQAATNQNTSKTINKF